MLVRGLITLVVVDPLLLQLRLQEPRIVHVIHLDRVRVGRWARYEPLIGRIVIQFRVHRDVEAGALLADRGNQRPQRLVTEDVSLFQPAVIDTLKRLDLVDAHGLEALEHELGAVQTFYAALHFLVELTQTHSIHLVEQEL